MELNKGVFIDGKEYVAKDTVISSQTLAKLGRAFSIAWANSVYDPPDDSMSNKYLREVSDLLSEVNEELKFKV